MSTKFKEGPHRKTTLSFPEEFLTQLNKYPGTMSIKVQLLCEYAMAAGCMMTMDEARKSAPAKLIEAVRSSRQVPKIFEGL